MDISHAKSCLAIVRKKALSAHISEEERQALHFAAGVVDKAMKAVELVRKARLYSRLGKRSEVLDEIGKHFGVE